MEDGGQMGAKCPRPRPGVLGAPTGTSQPAGDAAQGPTWPGTRSDEGHRRGKPEKCSFFFFSPRLFQEASLLLGTTSFWILLSDFG